MTNEKRIAMAVQRAVDRIGLAQMVDLAEVPRRTIQNHAAGICAPSVPALLAYVRACDEAGHPELGTALADGVLGLVGRGAHLVANAFPALNPSLLVMRATAEGGDVVREVERAMEDGALTYIEAGRIEKEVREWRHAVDEVDSLIRGVAAATPQRPLALAGGFGA